MQEQYRIYQRGGKNFYAKDTKTGRAFSLNTSDEHEAKRLVTAKNQSAEQPCLNVAMARVYLSAQSPEFTKRTWGQLIELVAEAYEGASSPCDLLAGFFPKRQIALSTRINFLPPIRRG